MAEVCAPPSLVNSDTVLFSLLQTNFSSLPPALLLCLCLRLHSFSSPLLEGKSLQNDPHVLHHQPTSNTEDHSAPCTYSPFSSLRAPLQLMTLTDSGGYTVHSSWIGTRDSFWYQRMNRCADFNQSSFVAKRVLTEKFGAKPAWLPDRFAAKSPQVSSAWHQVAPCSYYWFQSSPAGGITSAAPSWLAGGSCVGTVLIRMKTCAHIIKRPGNMGI